MSRLSVKKTYKLYVGGAFPRSESGRTFEADGHNVARASRKDARDAVRAARSALPAWSGMTAYNRGQILYRLAEMMEARASDLESACDGPRRGRGGDRSHRLVRGLGGQARAGHRQLEPRGRAVLRLHDPRADRRRRDRRSRGAAAARARLAVAPRARRRQHRRGPSRRRSIRSQRSSSSEALATSDFPPDRSTSSPASPTSSRRGWPATWTSTRSTSPASTATRPSSSERAAENVKRVVRSSGDCAEPVGDRGLPRAEDRLAPDRPLTGSSRSATATSLRSTHDRAVGRVRARARFRRAPRLR